MSAAPPLLRIELMGGMRVFLDDRPVTIPSLKARALIAALVLGRTGEERRDVLSERLWSRGQSSEHQRNSLKRDLKTVVDIFRAQGFDGLAGRRQTVALDLTRTESDLEEILRSAERGIAHAALLDLEAPFDRLAADVDDVDPEFSAWLAERRRFFTGMAVRALETALARPDLDMHRRLGIARAAFNLDGSRQPAALALMRVLEETGDVPGALRVYAAFYTSHMLEHDDPPQGEIDEIVQRLKAGTGHSLPPAPQAAERPARQEPARLRLDAPEATTDPALRRLALEILDILGRRPGQVDLVSGARAEFVLRLHADGADGAFLQLWSETPRRMVWSEHPRGLRDMAGLAVATRRLVAVMRGTPAPPDAADAPPVPGRDEPETFALRLLISRPGEPARPPAEGIDPDPNDAAQIADAGWLALMKGQKRDAIEALRRAASLDPGNPEILGAVALGLALLGVKAEAVRLADRLAARPGEASLRALRGTVLALCGDRHSAALCLSDLPESWVLPRGLGAAMADLVGDRTAALACLGPSLAAISRDSESFCDWAVRALPLPETAEPMMLRDRLARLLSTTTSETPGDLPETGGGG